MHTFVVSKHGPTSWLHWLAKSWGGWKDEKWDRQSQQWVPTDFCYWVRRVIYGAIFLSAVAGCLGALWIGASVASHSLIAEYFSNSALIVVLTIIFPPACAALFILALMGLTISLDKIYDWWRDREPTSLDTGVPPTKAQMFWSAVKARTCFRMKIEE